MPPKPSTKPASSSATASPSFSSLKSTASPNALRTTPSSPANVAQAINFYQTEGLLHGRPAISAADPTATQIIDNVHLTYKDNEVPTPGYSWFARTFTKHHIEIENDPRVWNQVEAMIQANLPPTTLATTATP